MIQYRSDAMKYLVLVIYLLWLRLSYVQSQCHQTANELLHIPHQNCLCSISYTGALRYHYNVFQICNGEKYVNVGRRYHYGTESNPGISCKDILDKNGFSQSRMYYLKVGQAVIEAYCYMENLCGSKGWTMIMKIDGYKSTFHYASSQWYSKEPYNPGRAAGGLDDHETKLSTYGYLPFNILCLGLKTQGGVNWLPLEYTAPSLHSLISDGAYKQTPKGPNAWESLIEGSFLQNNCTKEGINVKVGFGSMTRIGIIGSSDTQCLTSESRIGFGTGGNRCGQDDSNSAGNEARCGADGRDDKSIKGFGYIFGKKVPPILGSLTNPASSCLDIKANGSDTSSNGVYYLNLNGEKTLVYCHMENICNSSGWTLIMKMDGHKSTFLYSSTFWTSHETFNVDAGAAGGLDNQETKLKTYSNFAFQKLCLGMKTTDTINWISLQYPAVSLYSLIADDQHRKTNEGLQKWKSLIPGSSLQTRCNDEGFNTDSQGGAQARIGIIGNHENHCKSGDSRLGFGTGGNRCRQDEKNSVGNEARCKADNGDKSIRTFGFILAQ